MKNLERAKNIEGRIVLVRGSLNVPLTKEGDVADDFRLRMLFLTLDFLLQKKTKIVLIGHLGRDVQDSLEPVFEYLLKKSPLKTKVYFNKNTFQNFNDDKIIKIKKEISELKNGEILLLDNLRQNLGEKENDKFFRENLRSLGEIYVQDAFSVSHRQHASMMIEPDYFGLQYRREIENLSKVLQPESPSIFILGGAKVKTKIPLLEKALEKYNQVIVGGVIANVFYQYLGFDIKDSLVEDVDKNILKNILEKDNFILPDFHTLI